jgi:hypothetical protein
MRGRESTRSSWKIKLGERPSKPGEPSQPGGGASRTPQEYGPECGGKGGVPYLSVFQPQARLVRITVWHRDYVDGIQLETDLSVLPRIGGTGKHRDVQRDVIALAKDEILTGITVMYWQYIDQITFHTNQRSYGAYGGAGGQVSRTLLSPPGRTVAGFRGRHWELVDSIQLMVG